MNDAKTQAHGLSAYRRVVAAPGVRAAAIASVIARVPIGLGSVALVLYVHRLTGSFADAGIAAGAMTIGFGLTASSLARAIDRRGPRAVLVPFGLASALLTASIVALGEAGAGTAALAVAALLAGATTPPLGGVLRQRWPQLVPAHDLPTAYAVDSILLEAIFVSGPLLAGLFAATIGPGDGLLAGAALGLLGIVWFATMPIAAGGGHPEAREPKAPGVLSSPTMRMLILGSIPVGATFGCLDVALPAFGVAHGSAALGGPFAAALAFGSALGGIAYGARPHALGAPGRSFGLLSAAQFLTCLPMLLVSSVGAMLVVAGAAGLCIAPLVTVRNQLVHAAMPPGTGTEAFTWTTVAFLVGASAGSALAGPVVQAGGWQAGVVVAIALPAVGLALQVASGRGVWVEAQTDAAPIAAE